GRASPIIINERAISRKINNNGFSLAKKELCGLNPLSELIVKVADCFFRLKIYNAISPGDKTKSKKNSGSQKVMFSIVYLACINSTEFIILSVISFLFTSSSSI